MTDLYEKFKNEQCPVCGYYCAGKGGIGCIDKPALCDLQGTQDKSKSLDNCRKCNTELYDVGLERPVSRACAYPEDCPVKSLEKKDGNA